MKKWLAYGIIVPVVGISVSILSSIVISNVVKKEITNYHVETKADEIKNYSGIGFLAKDDYNHSTSSYYSYSKKANDIADYSYSELRGLKSYKVGDIEVTYNNKYANTIQETTLVNGNKEYFSYFAEGDDYIDALCFGNNAITYFYNDDYSLDFICANNTSIDIEYNNNEVDNVLVDDDYGYIKYTYDNDGLASYRGFNNSVTNKADALNGPVTTINASVGSIGLSNATFDIKYGLTKNDNKSYIDNFNLDGKKYSLSYFNNKIINVECDNKNLSYIVDSSNNYLGCCFDNSYYLFVFDGCGLLKEILSEDGKSELVYDVSPFGGVTIYGDNLDLATYNIVIGLDLYGNPSTQTIFDSDNLYYYPNKAKVNINTQAVSTIDDKDLLNKKHENIKKDNTFGIDLIEGKILEDVRNKLTSLGFSVYQNIPVYDDEGNFYNPIDIYFCDMRDEAKPNINNLRYQNQALYLYSNDMHSENESILNQASLNNYKARMIQKREFKKAEYDIEGDLFYLSYSIHYHTKNGFIYYELRDNKINNIIGSGNVYDYSSNTYVRYVNSDVSVNNFDFSKIVPGLNREAYDQINDAINDQFRIALEMDFSGLGNADMSEYQQAIYYDEVGDTTPLLKDAVENHYYTVTSAGDIKIATIPWYENKDTIKAVVKVGAVLAAAAVASVVSIYCPAVGTIVMPITVAFLKGFVGSLLINGAFTAFDIITSIGDPGFDFDLAISESLLSLTNQSIRAGAINAVFAAINLGVNAYVKHSTGLSDLKRTITGYETDFATNGYNPYFNSDVESYEFYMHYKLEYTRILDSVTNSGTYKAYNLVMNCKTGYHFVGNITHNLEAPIKEGVKEICQRIPILKPFSSL